MICQGFSLIPAPCCVCGWCKPWTLSVLRHRALPCSYPQQLQRLVPGAHQPVLPSNNIPEMFTRYVPKINTQKENLLKTVKLRSCGAPRLPCWHFTAPGGLPMDWDGAALQRFGRRMGLFAFHILMFCVWSRARSWEQPFSPRSGCCRSHPARIPLPTSRCPPGCCAQSGA